jgi:cation transport ATPase
MSEGRHKEEKDEEKRREKDEKEDEKRKGWDEKWRRDRVNAVAWAVVIIWGALVILAETTGYAKDNFSWWEGWAVFFAGAGAVLLLTAFYRLLVPEHRRAMAGNVIIGLVLLGIGLGSLISWNYIWVIVLIAIALMILLRAFVPRR